MNTIQVMGAFSAGLAALVAFLLALPAESIPQIIMIVLGGLNAFLAAVMIFLSQPMNIARMAVNKHKPELKVAQKEAGE